MWNGCAGILDIGVLNLCFYLQYGVCCIIYCLCTTNMAMSNRSLRLRVFSGILKEFQLAKQAHSPSYRYLVDQYKSNQVGFLGYCQVGLDTHVFFCYF